MLHQVEVIALREKAAAVERIVLRMGPLCGVVPELLHRAFTLARAGSIAEQAKLTTEIQPVRIHCLQCGYESEVPVNHLICDSCGSYRTQLISGDELLLARVELTRQ
jgi:hydrogenase nickel incorporation protein HypA/HybF